MWEKSDVVNLVPVIMNMTRRWASLRLSTVGDYRGHESLVIRLLHDEEQELHFWFQDIEELASSTGNEDSIFCWSSRKWQDDFDA